MIMQIGRWRHAATPGQPIRAQLVEELATARSEAAESVSAMGKTAAPKFSSIFFFLHQAVL